MPSNNRIIIAAAGSGKSTFIVEEAISASGNTLLTTYTNENISVLNKYVYARVRSIPQHMCISTLLSFFLVDGVRPYQNFLTSSRRVKSVDFLSKPDRFAKRDSDIRFFLNRSNDIYKDRISDFACLANERSNGMVIKRIAELYQNIYIDEVQDLNGYDIEFLQYLFESNINVTVAGDPRQATYTTNFSSKYKKFKGHNITKLFETWEKAGLCNIIVKDESHRCNQEICDFADKLHPDMVSTKSRTTPHPEHSGVFVISSKDALNYANLFAPAILRWDKKETAQGLEAMNYGSTKGQEYDRVLIFPTGPIEKFLSNPLAGLKDVSRAKLYVAITRARHSVAFVYDGKIGHDIIQRFDG